MKLIVHVLAVISLTVFRTDCRERPNVREMSDDDHNHSDDLGVLDDRDLSNDGELSNSLDVSYGPDLSDGPNSESSTSFPYAHLYSTQNNRELSNVVDLPNSRGVSYGPELSSGPNNESSTSFPYAHLYSNRVNVDIPAVEVVPGLVPDGFENYDFSIVYHQQKEDERLQNEGKLRGGSKCKPDIVCSLLGGSCVANSTYCSGREVSSLCNGAKCKCCIPVTLEVKMHELETELRSMVVNLTIANSNLHTNINSMVNSLMSNLTIENANMVDLMNTSNTNLTSLNSNMQNQLQVVTENLTNANANLVSKLDSIRERQGCPEDMFLFAPSNQCFQLLNKTSWDTANASCSALGLQLAQPYDPVSLRSFLIAKYGNRGYTWMGARGSGSAMTWQRTGEPIGLAHPLWWPGSPGNCVHTGCCLTLLTHEGEWKSHPINLYYVVGCNRILWTLCELVTE